MTSASRTQRITAVDIRNGRIRIPIGEKEPFPDSADRMAIWLRGRQFADVAWDPRYGPDRERSGVLYVGRQIRDLVAPDEVLLVTNLDGEIRLN
jgi:hypothetical protein